MRREMNRKDATRAVRELPLLWTGAGAEKTGRSNQRHCPPNKTGRV
jgi:hypothetical protein